MYGAGRWIACLCRGWMACIGALAVGGLPATQVSAAARDAAPSRAVAAASGPIASPTLRKIRARGEVAVGVRTDYPPFGWIDAKGRHRGLEADLAQELADHLRVRLRLVPVNGEDRFARLRHGRVDVLIASAVDTPARRAQAAAVEPHYYGSGVDVLLRPERHETRWLHLRGSTLCAVQEAAFNPQVRQRHHVDLHVSPSLGEALKTLRSGRCSGLLYTEATVQHLRRLPDWSDYRAPLAPTLVMPWAISIARSEQGTVFEREIGDAVARWHREGTLIELERKWGLKPSAFLRQAHARWSALQPDGAPACARDAQGRWPLACRGQALMEPLPAGVHAASRMPQTAALAWTGLLVAVVGMVSLAYWRLRNGRVVPVPNAQPAAAGMVRAKDPQGSRPWAPVPFMPAARTRMQRPIRPRRRSLRRRPIRT